MNINKAMVRTIELTPEEQALANQVSALYESFAALPNNAEDDLHDWQRAVEDLQKVFIARVNRRGAAEVFPQKMVITTTAGHSFA